MKKLIVFVLILTVTAGHAQEKISRPQLIDDCNTYLQYLEDTHPDPYTGYGGQVEFKRAAQKLRDSISEETSVEQFHEMLSAFVAVLGDGHTAFNALNEEQSLVETSALTLPVQLKTATDGLFISRTTNAYRQYLGARILAINDLPVDDVLEKVKKIAPSENRYGEYHALCQLIADDRSAALLFGSTGSIRFSLQMATGDTREVDMAWIEKPEWIAPRSKLKLKNENPLLYGQLIEKDKKTAGYFVWNSVTSRETVEEIAQNPNPEYLEMNLNALYNQTLKIPRPKDDKLAIRGIPSLYAAFSDLLKTMKAGKAESLIIDLRANGGGMTALCRPLLYMLYGDKYLNYNNKAEYNRRLSSLMLKKWGLDSIAMYNRGNNTNYRLGDFIFGYFFGSTDTRPVEEKRKDLSLITYYRKIGAEYTKDLNGKPLYEPRVVVVLTSPETFSAAYHFMYLLAQIGDAKVIGVPSRQAGNTFMETTPFELPNTRISGSISNSIQIFFPDDPVKGKTFMPDCPMNWSDFAKYDFDENAEILYALDMMTAR